MSNVRKNDFARAINALTYKEMLEVARDLGVMLDVDPKIVPGYLGLVADRILDPDNTRPETEVPGSVYYSPTLDYFYSAVSHEGMGKDFYGKWFKRRAEFPQPEEEPKPVLPLRNPVSKPTPGADEFQHKDHKS